MSFPVSLELSLDLDDTIGGIIESCQQIGREEFVQRSLEQFFQALDEYREETGNASYVLIVSLSQNQRCKRMFDGNYKSYSLTWEQGADRHDFQVYLFFRGFYNHKAEDGGYKNWAFVGGERFHTPMFAEQHPDGNRGYVVWSDLKDTVGGDGGNVSYASYWGDKRGIESIVVKTAYDDDSDCDVIAAIIFNYKDDCEEIGRDQEDDGEKITFNSNDRLVGISVKASDLVNAIKFHIYNDQAEETTETEWIGTEEGEETYFEDAKGIYGKCGSKIDSLGIFY